MGSYKIGACARGKPHSRRSALLGFIFPVLAILAGVDSINAQTLTAVDDDYGIPYGEPLIVEPFGVLDNDILDGESAGEMGAAAELVTDANHGALTLYTDGSFTYSPGAGFDGSDSFVYRAVFGAASAEATVLLSACSGGPDIFTCWNETAYLSLAAAFNFTSFTEGFEDDAAWGGARSPATSPAVVSQGIRWMSNHPDAPAFNEITTGPGPARTGLWAIFDLDHGYATGTEGECDIDNPPLHCLYHDGFTGVREPGSIPLHGVGGYFTGIYGANVGISLDNATPIGGGQLAGGHQFFGAIDTRPPGFSRFELRELDGKIGNALYLFADDFTLLTEIPTTAAETSPRETGWISGSAGPNPSRGGTILYFDLTAEARVRVAIYNARGALVRELTDEFRDIGSHAVGWDGRNGAGRTVAAGIYFGRLVVTSGIEREIIVRKITIVR